MRWLAGLCGLGAALGATAALAAPPSGPGVRVMSWRDIPFRTVVRQQFDYSCGSAAVATFMTYHAGLSTTETDAFRAMFDIGDKAKIQKQGFSMLDMKRFMAGHGVKTEGFRMSIADVQSAGAPVIALINIGNYRHFVVIKGVQGNQVLVGDPALGLKVYSKAEFATMWNGVVLALQTPSNAARGRFNVASEWQPWSAAPVRTASGAQSLTRLTDNFTPLYQITDVRVTGVDTIRGLQ